MQRDSERKIWFHQYLVNAKSTLDTITNDSSIEGTLYLMQANKLRNEIVSALEKGWHDELYTNLDRQAADLLPRYSIFVKINNLYSSFTHELLEMKYNHNNGSGLAQHGKKNIVIMEILLGHIDKVIIKVGIDNYDYNHARDIYMTSDNFQLSRLLFYS